MIARQSIQHNILDRDPYQLSTEEKIFLVAKRGCIGFAGIALMLGLLDFANIHSTDDALAAWQNNRVKILALGDTVRNGVQSISISAPPAAEGVAVRIPASTPAPAAAKIERNEKRTKLDKKESPIAELSAARTQDALQIAMMPPAAMLPVPAPKIEAAAPAAVAAPAPQLTQPMMSPTTLAKRDTWSSTLAYAPKTDLYEDLAKPQPQPIRLSIDTPEAQTVVTPAVVAPVIAETAAPAIPAIPLALVPLPREAPGAPPPSPAELLHLKGKDYTRAERCLANAVYFEARSEPVRGQIAVAQVVMNRVFSGFYPNDVCSVVYQNAGRHLACQFTFACDGKNKAINERGSWARANRIAKQTLEGQIYLPEVAKSTHYHASYVHPSWAHEMKRLARFGLHSFYRPYAWGNGAEDPVWGSAALAQASVRKTASK